MIPLIQLKEYLGNSGERGREQTSSWIQRDPRIFQEDSIEFVKT